MFKIIALVGAIAGGATYGLYAHTDIFGEKCDGSGCQLAAQKSCCEGKEATTPSCCATPCPTCAKGCDECCEVCAVCCGEGKAVTVSASAPKPEACCATKVSVTKASPCCATIVTAAKTSACCADPCPDCVKAACEACAECVTCCGAAAKTAIAGPAGSLVGAAKK